MYIYIYIYTCYAAGLRWNVASVSMYDIVMLISLFAVVRCLSKQASLLHVLVYS